MIYLVNPSLHLVSNNYYQSLLFKADFNINILCVITMKKRSIKRQHRAKDLAVLAVLIPVKKLIGLFLKYTNVSQQKKGE